MLNAKAITDFAHEKRIAEVAFKTNLKPSQVEEIIELLYEYISIKLNNVKLENPSRVLTEEEFYDIFKIFTIPKLGYLTPNYRRYRHMMKNKLKNNNNENSNSDSDSN